MTKIEKMIQELCPNGVEYKKLKNVCIDFIVPMRDRPKIFDGDIPWCRIEDKEGQYFNKSLSGLGVSRKIIKEMNLKIFPVGTVICSCSASIGAYAINTQPLITNQTFIGLVCGKNLYNRYLLYFMETQTKTLLQLATTGTIPYISRKKFEELIIPVPPLEVQNEIVHILDNFTGLIEELTKELTARKKQYEYYRNKLLTFAEFDSTLEAEKQRSREAVIRHLQHVFGYAYVTLDDIAINYDIQRKPVTSEKREKGNIPYYGASGIIDYVKDYIFDGDYLLISEDGANLLTRTMPIAFSISGKAWVNNHAHVLKFKEYATRRYVEMYLNSIDLTPYITGAAQPKLNQKNLNKIKIPLPILEEQEKIVTILDHFDTLCNDLTTGLPAEIEARKKQYEYYRDKLLSF